MSAHPKIHARGDHRYLVTAPHEDDVVQIAVYASPTFMERVGAPRGTEVDVVVRVLGFLLEHQTIDELPPQLDLEEVAAAYEGVEARVRDRVRESAS